MIKKIFALFAFLALATTSVVEANEPAPPVDFSGLWMAKRNFTPEVRGSLTLREIEGKHIASIAGFTVSALVQGENISFEISGERGRFVGRLNNMDGSIQGHWIQPRLVRMGLEAVSPVVLKKREDGLWRGEVFLIEDAYTFFLSLNKKEDGTLGGFLRNPERNLGVFLPIDRVEIDGNNLKFLRSNGGVLFEGVYDPNWQKFSVYIHNRGGSFDFVRVDDDEGSAFYGRGKNPAPYQYIPPLDEQDGWTVGTLDEVGISLGPIQSMIEKEIDIPATSVDDQYIHGLLIARYGKLVFEDYFYGFHGERTHDTRSASKSLTAVLTGAAIEEGADLDQSTLVYENIYGGDLPENLDPLKKQITLGNLLTMSSGFFCDDRNPDAPGNEEVMQEQEEEPNWYKYTLALPMAIEPGKEAIYCSINPNLVGNVLMAKTGKTLPVLFEELIAEPLQIDRYHLILQPTGEPYMGGGIHWLPRDFMKLGQLMLSKGVWNGKRVLSEEWVEESSSALYEIRGRQYGYLWWVVDYPYKDRTVGAFFAGGNGGQTVMTIPELDLVITFYGGNYSSRTLFRIYEVMIPDYILPAIKE